MILLAARHSLKVHKREKFFGSGFEFFTSFLSFSSVILTTSIQQQHFSRFSSQTILFVSEMEKT
jgi:hypothetical protein